MKTLKVVYLNGNWNVGGFLPDGVVAKLFRYSRDSLPERAAKYSILMEPPKCLLVYLLKVHIEVHITSNSDDVPEASSLMWCMLLTNVPAAAKTSSAYSSGLA